jgi:broad specificity phosphatase PhoE
MNDMKTYLLRHGSTTANENNPPILQGRSLDLPLSLLGQSQAEKTAEFFSKRKIDRIFCSPLKRAFETASIIANKCGASIEVDESIIECSLGLWEGMTFNETKIKFPVDHQWFISDTGHRCYPKGESYAKVLERAIPFFDRINGIDGVNVVVSHGIVNKAYVSHLLDLPLKLAKNLPQDNCGINYISQDKKVHIINSVDHLLF